MNLVGVHGLDLEDLVSIVVRVWLDSSTGNVRWFFIIGNYKYSSSNYGTVFGIKQ